MPPGAGFYDCSSKSAGYRPSADPEARSSFSRRVEQDALANCADRAQFLCHSAVGRQEFRCHAAPKMMRKCMICKQLLLKTEAIPHAVSRFSLTAGEFRSAAKCGFGSPANEAISRSQQLRRRERAM